MYDLQRSKWGAGVSYYRYFNKDSLDFYTSPLVNELYAYAAYRKGWLQPKLALDYGWGSYSELVDLGLDSATIRRLRQRFPNMPLPKRFATTETKVNDFSIIASIRHPFRKKEVFGKSDWFVFTPTLMLVAGTSNFGTNLPLNTAGSYTIRQATMNSYLQSLYQTEYSSGFRLQSFNTLLAADYYLGKFYVGATCMIMYTIPAELSRWNVIGNLNVGIRL
jgi:hypothetical protein